MKALLLTLLLASSLAMGACNTFKGMGRDLQSAGNWMQGRHHDDTTSYEYHEYRANDY